MKKIISVILAILVFALFAAPICTLAAGTPTFEVSSVNVKAGEKFTVDISIKNNPGLASAKFEVKFDDDLTLDDVDFGDKLEGMTGTSPTLNSPATLNWVSLQKDLTEDTVYATLSFTALKTASEGKHNITISYDPADVFDLSTKQIDFKIKNGVVTIGSAAAKTTSDKKADSSAAKSVSSADTAATESSSVGSVDEDGEYVGGEELIEFEDESGNDIAAETTGAKKVAPIWVFAIIAVVIIAVIVVVIFILKNKKKTEEKTEE